MHSSRMRTARSLTVSSSICRGGGHVPLPCTSPHYAMHAPPATHDPPAMHTPPCHACPPPFVDRQTPVRT